MVRNTEIACGHGAFAGDCFFGGERRGGKRLSLFVERNIKSGLFPRHYVLGNIGENRFAEIGQERAGEIEKGAEAILFQQNGKRCLGRLQLSKLRRSGFPLLNGGGELYRFAEVETAMERDLRAGRILLQNRFDRESGVGQVGRDNGLFDISGVEVDGSGCFSDGQARRSLDQRLEEIFPGEGNRQFVRGFVDFCESLQILFHESENRFENGKLIVGDFGGDVGVSENGETFLPALRTEEPHVVLCTRFDPFEGRLDFLFEFEDFLFGKDRREGWIEVGERGLWQKAGEEIPEAAIFEQEEQRICGNFIESNGRFPSHQFVKEDGRGRLVRKFDGIARYDTFFRVQKKFGTRNAEIIRIHGPEERVLFELVDVVAKRLIGNGYGVLVLIPVLVRSVMQAGQCFQEIEDEIIRKGFAGGAQVDGISEEGGGVGACGTRGVSDFRAEILLGIGYPDVVALLFEKELKRGFPEEVRIDIAAKAIVDGHGLNAIVGLHGDRRRKSIDCHLCERQTCQKGNGVERMDIFRGFPIFVFPCADGKIEWLFGEEIGFFRSGQEGPHSGKDRSAVDPFRLDIANGSIDLTVGRELHGEQEILFGGLVGVGEARIEGACGEQAGRQEMDWFHLRVRLS